MVNQIVPIGYIKQLCICMCICKTSRVSGMGVGNWTFGVGQDDSTTDHFLLEAEEPHKDDKLTMSLVVRWNF